MPAHEECTNKTNLVHRGNAAERSGFFPTVCWAGDSYLSRYWGVGRHYEWDGTYLKVYQGSRRYQGDGRYLSKLYGLFETCLGTESL